MSTEKETEQTKPEPPKPEPPPLTEDELNVTLWC